MIMHMYKYVYAWLYLMIFYQEWSPGDDIRISYARA